jgi:hypothetical protein
MIWMHGFLFEWSLKVWKMNLKRILKKKIPKPQTPSLFPSGPADPSLFLPLFSQPASQPGLPAFFSSRPSNAFPRRPNRASPPFLFAPVTDRWGPAVRPSPYLQPAGQPRPIHGRRPLPAGSAASPPSKPLNQVQWSSPFTPPLQAGLFPSLNLTLLNSIKAAWPLMAMPAGSRLPSPLRPI